MLRQVSDERLAELIRTAMSRNRLGQYLEDASQSMRLVPANPDKCVLFLVAALRELGCVVADDAEDKT